MKKTFIKYFILIMILLVFAACWNPSASSVYMAPGTGLVSLTINKVDTARTILPAPKLSDFEEIVLLFTDSDENETEIAGNSEDLENLISLAEGIYTLKVTAYADNARTETAAEKIVTGIVVDDGKITPVTITLDVAALGVGAGTFSWDITYPGVTVNGATLTITPINPTGTAQTINPLNITSLTLNSGEYRVVFSLRDNQGQTAELTEILHVYNNLTSTFEYVFTSDNFNFLKIKQVTNYINGEATVTFDGLNNNTIYLVKVNTNTTVVNAVNTGNAVLSSPPSLSPSASPPLRNSPNKVELPRMGHPEAEKFHANPPPFIKQQPQGSQLPAPNPVIGEIRSFWVEATYGNGDWVQKPAILSAKGNYCNVWWVIADDVDQAVADSVATAFDKIYLAETNILGYEYGGGPDGDGGADGDKSIQILFYDIGAAGGFFWSKDFYHQEWLDARWNPVPMTNLAEIFYVNIGMPLEYTLSTLAHEFQHMINFSRKSVDKTLSSPSWYNEMLSVMTEDVMASIIGIELTDYYHSIHVRMPTFLSDPTRGITEWSTLDGGHYAKAFAFGAYLMRNYGGVELLSKIMANNAVGVPSITAALNEIYEGMTFEHALARFGEALVFNSAEESDSVVTFNKAINYSKINPQDGKTYTYTAPAIDVWRESWNNITGYTPLILNLNQREMRPSSVSVHSDDSWKNITGSTTITLQKPTVPQPVANEPPAKEVMFFLMVR